MDRGVVDLAVLQRGRNPSADGSATVERGGAEEDRAQVDREGVEDEDLDCGGAVVQGVDREVEDLAVLQRGRNPSADGSATAVVVQRVGREGAAAPAGHHLCMRGM